MAENMQAVDAVEQKGAEGPKLSEEDRVFCEALEGRAAFYETLASLYFKPLTQKQIDAMGEADFSPYADINKRFAVGVNDITRYLRKRNTGTRQDLAVDFTSAFAGTKVYEGRSAVPYESVFTSEEGLLYQESYHEVYLAYRQSYIVKKDGLDYPDDHLSFMCQFLAMMSRRAKRAVVEEKWLQVEKGLQTSLDFLETHIVPWFDDFVELSEKIIKTRFYRGVLELSQGFLEVDRQTLADMLEEAGGRRHVRCA